MIALEEAADGHWQIAYIKNYRDYLDTVAPLINGDIADYISRPFDARIVHRRVSNVARLYARQRRLSALVSQQFYDREKNDQIMIGILSQVTEIHNSESIHHTSRVQRITSILLERLCQKTDIYGLSGMDRYLITTASALHDIGKVAIDDRILNAHDLTPSQPHIVSPRHGYSA